MTQDSKQPREKTGERRAGRDRRARDVAAPGARDRRCGLEPRKPEVDEIEATDSVWASFEPDLPGPGPSSFK